MNRDTQGDLFRGEEREAWVVLRPSSWWRFWQGYFDWADQTDDADDDAMYKVWGDPDARDD